MRNQFVSAVTILMLAIIGILYMLHLKMPIFDTPALFIGNFVLYLLTLISYRLVLRKVDQRPQAFVQGVTSGTLLKIAVIIGVVLVYAVGFRTRVHKPSLFVFFGMYAMYTTLETIALSRLAKRKNAEKHA